MTFRIREARELVNLNQRELAAKLGISPATLNGYELGNHDPKSDMLSRIADICGVTVDFLLSRAPDPPKQPYKNALQEEATRLALRILALDRHGQKAVMAILAVEEERLSIRWENTP